MCLSDASKVIIGKESLNERRAFARGEIRMILQKVTNGNQTLLQGPEFGPFDSGELGILEMVLINIIKAMIGLTEIIDPRMFWKHGRAKLAHIQKIKY
jgi:hypothetical protein